MLPMGRGPAVAAEHVGAPGVPPAGGLSPGATRLRPETSPYEVVEVGGQGRAMETPRRMQSGSRGGSSPLPPPFPTPGRQLAHWPVQTPPGASRVSPFRPSPWRHRDAPPHPKLRPRPRPRVPSPWRRATPPAGLASACPAVQGPADPPPFLSCLGPPLVP